MERNDKDRIEGIITVYSSWLADRIMKDGVYCSIGIQMMSNLSKNLFLLSTLLPMRYNVCVGNKTVEVDAREGAYQYG